MVYCLGWLFNTLITVGLFDFDLILNGVGVCMVLFIFDVFWLLICALVVTCVLVCSLLVGLF